MARFLWVRHKRVIPVPQLQPLDARDIIKHQVVARASDYPCNRWKEVYWVYCQGNNLLHPPRPPLPEVPDMIVFSDDDPFEVLKKC